MTLRNSASTLKANENGNDLKKNIVLSHLINRNRMVVVGYDFFVQLVMCFVSPTCQGSGLENT